MEIIFNLSKEERKTLVAAISELTGWASVYKGAPSFAFAVNNYIIERNGTIIYDERTSVEEVRVLLTGLEECGFVFEGDIDKIAPVETEPGEISGVEAADGMGACFTQSSENDENERDYQNGTPSENTSTADVPDRQEVENGGNERTPRNGDPFENASTTDASDRLELELPLEGFTRTALDNLDKLVEGKAPLIMKSIGTDALPIVRTESTLQFPWFPLSASKDEIDAYSKFVCALSNLAKKQKRVTMKESKAESEGSEKYAFRCFLLRLGFIGDDYKTVRNVLLSKLSGNGSFKTGDHKRVDAPETAINADSGEETAEAITVHESEHGANSPATGGEDAIPMQCGDCPHHCYYYTDGLLRKSSGETVDTSNRMPDKYTHYCLGTPSGFRKIKHATDWSGCEIAPKWCPLQSESSNGITIREDESDTQNTAVSGTETPYTYDPDLSNYDLLMSRGGN